MWYESSLGEVATKVAWTLVEVRLSDWYQKLRLVWWPGSVEIETINSNMWARQTGLANLNHDSALNIFMRALKSINLALPLRLYTGTTKRHSPRRCR